MFSDIQNIWDAYKDDAHANLVLSGSVLLMMKKIFTDAHEPLLGRADNIIRLKPLRIDVIRQMLSDYYPALNNEYLLALYKYEVDAWLSQWKICRRREKNGRRVVGVWECFAIFAG